MKTQLFPIGNLFLTYGAVCALTDSQGQSWDKTLEEILEKHQSGDHGKVEERILEHNKTRYSLVRGEGEDILMASIRSRYVWVGGHTHNLQVLTRYESRRVTTTIFTDSEASSFD